MAQPLESVYQKRRKSLWRGISKRPMINIMQRLVTSCPIESIFHNNACLIVLLQVCIASCPKTAISVRKTIKPILISKAGIECGICKSLVGIGAIVEIHVCEQVVILGQ